EHVYQRQLLAGTHRCHGQGNDREQPDRVSMWKCKPRAAAKEPDARSRGEELDETRAFRVRGRKAGISFGDGALGSHFAPSLAASAPIEHPRFCRFDNEGTRRFRILCAPTE